MVNRVRAGGLPPRFDSRVADAIQAAQQDGDREGHTRGWREGFLCGLFWACLGSAIGVGACFSLGWFR